MAVSLRRDLALPLRVMAILVIAIAACFSTGAAKGCDLAPTLYVSVNNRFEGTTSRSDFTLQDIQVMVRDNGVGGRQVLGFYLGQFGYTVDIGAQAGRGCPGQTEASVTFHLMHRVIQLGRQVAANACLYPVALAHYRRMAVADEQIVKQYSAIAAIALTGASPDLRRVDQVNTDAGGLTLRERIGVVVNEAIKPLQEARRRAVQAINSSDELRRLVSACAG